MMLLARQDSRALVPASAPAPASATPPLNPEPYRTVPLFNQRSVLLGLTISFMVFSWICSLLRLYTRLIIIRAPGWDDFFMVLCLVSTTTGSIILCILPNLGLGRSMYTLTLPEKEEFLRVLYIGGATYPLSATLIKLALLFQYLRIFEPGSGHSVFCKSMIVVTILWGMTFTVLRWVPCYPVAAYWDFSIEDARCWGFGSHDLLEYMRVFVSHGTSTALLDLIIFTIPARLYLKPDTQRRTRLSLLGLFVLGLFVNLCSIGRMVYIIRIYMAGTWRFDPSWYTPTTAGLACLEVHLAAVCAALPVFWPVLTTILDRIFVTYEVSVTLEYGRFTSKASGMVELQSTASHRILTPEPPQGSADPEGWEPFVGDETTGLGESETVIQSPAAAKRSRKVRDILGLQRQQV